MRKARFFIKNDNSGRHNYPIGLLIVMSISTLGFLFLSCCYTRPNEDWGEHQKGEILIAIIISGFFMSAVFLALWIVNLAKCF